MRFVRKNGGAVRPRDAYRSPFRGRCLPGDRRAEMIIKKNSTRPVQGGERERRTARERAFVRLSRVKLDSGRGTRRALRTIFDAYRIRSYDEDDDAPFFPSPPPRHPPAVPCPRAPRVPPSPFPARGSRSLSLFLTPASQPSRKASLASFSLFFSLPPPSRAPLLAEPSLLSLRAVRFTGSALHATERELQLFLRMGNDPALFLESTRTTKRARRR